MQFLWSKAEQSKEWHFKVRIAQKSGYRETYEERHGIPEQIDRDFEEVPGIWIVSHSRYYFWII